MKKTNRVLVVALAVALLAVAAMGATLAWLISSTEEVENTFVVGAKVNIELTEEQADDVLSTEFVANESASYWLVPGKEIEKDPTITVKANSENCYVFAKVTTTGDMFKVTGAKDETKIMYTIADGWELVEEDAGVAVYARLVSKNEADQSFSVLAGDAVEVGEYYAADTVATDSTLTVQAYAIQADFLQDGDTAGTATAEEYANAWAELNEQMAMA